VQLEKDIQKIERELSTQKNEYEYINSAIDISLAKCEIDKEGQIISANHSMEKLTGFAIKELLDKKFNDLLELEQAKSFERIWENIVSGHSFNNIIKFEAITKEKKLVKSSFKPIRNEQNEMIKVIFIGDNQQSDVITD
jgi:PAS domain S-box-containing protein